MTFLASDCPFTSFFQRFWYLNRHIFSSSMHTGIATVSSWIIFCIHTVDRILQLSKLFQKGRKAGTSASNMKRLSKPRKLCNTQKDICCRGRVTGEYVVESSGENTRMQEDFDSWEKGKGCQLLSPTPAAATHYSQEH